MDFFKLTVILLLTTTKVKSDVSNLQDHQSQNVDPLQEDTNDTQHEQSKRTLCQTCQPTSTYVKRLIIKGGYALRPTGYRYPKPKIQFRLKAPAILRQQVWKQFSTASRPAIVEVPAPNLKAVEHGNHIDVQPSVVHPHVDHSVAAAVAPSVLTPQAFIPSPPAPVLFEVTRPNLGVLPLGARFNVPLLVPAQSQPHYHLQPQPDYHLHPQPHYHLQPSLLPQHHPGVVPHQFSAHAHFLQPQEHHVQALPHEHHTQFVPAHAQALPHEHHVQFLQQQHQFLPHEHQAQFIQQQQQLPHEHQAQFLQQQQQLLPHEHQAQFIQQQHQYLPHEHQSLPHEHQIQFLQHQQHQQLPHEHQVQFQSQSLPQDYQNQYAQQSHYPVDVPQYQLPLEGEETQQLNGNVIQPGQTDVQIPYHLPQHGNWPSAAEK